MELIILAVLATVTIVGTLASVYRDQRNIPPYEDARMVRYCETHRSIVDVAPPCHRKSSKGTAYEDGCRVTQRWFMP